MRLSLLTLLSLASCTRPAPLHAPPALTGTWVRHAPCGADLSKRTYRVFDDGSFLFEGGIEAIDGGVGRHCLPSYGAAEGWVFSGAGSNTLEWRSTRSESREADVHAFGPKHEETTYALDGHHLSLRVFQVDHLDGPEPIGSWTQRWTETFVVEELWRRNHVVTHETQLLVRADGRCTMSERAPSKEKIECTWKLAGDQLTLERGKYRPLTFTIRGGALIDEQLDFVRELE